MPPAYASTHQNYPLLLPMLEATWFRFAGTVDTQAVHVELWLLLIGFVWAAAFVLARRGAPVVTWAPVLMLVAIATGTYSHHVPADPDVPLRNAFNLPYLFGRLQRLGPSFSALHHQLADQRIWSYVLPIGAGIALACMVWRVARRQAAFYLATGTLICLLYVGVYWFSPLDLKYYLGTSSYRVIDVIVFIGAAAALQLPAEIQARRRT